MEKMEKCANAFWNTDRDMVELEIGNGSDEYVGTAFMTIQEALELSLRLQWVAEMVVGRHINFGSHWYPVDREAEEREMTRPVDTEI